MKKEVEKMFIGKAINRTATLTGWPNSASNNLAAGEILILDENKEIMAAGATIADSGKIYIVEGTSTTYDYVNEAGTSVTGVRKVVMSDAIDGSAVTAWSGKSYTAPAEAVWTVDLTGWTPVIGTEYAIRVLYKDLFEDPRQFAKTYRYVATSATLATELTAIVALINADKHRRVQATEASNTDLILTGKVYDDKTGLDVVSQQNQYAQVNFEVFLISDNFDTYTSSALTTVPSKGEGHWKVVADQEKWSQGYEGFSNRLTFPVVQPTFRTVVDETYDTLVINSKNWYTSASGREEQVDISTKIILPDDAGQTANILAVLNPWMESTPKAFTNVTV